MENAKSYILRIPLELLVQVLKQLDKRHPCLFVCKAFYDVAIILLHLNHVFSLSLCGDPKQEMLVKLLIKNPTLAMHIHTFHICLDVNNTSARFNSESQALF